MAKDTCCKAFDPAPWEDQTFEWKDKFFIKGRVLTFLYVPMNFGQVMRRLVRLAEPSDAMTSDQLALSQHMSPWRMDVYLAVQREVPGAENMTLSGRFYSKVYEGPFSKTKEWCEDFEAAAGEKGLAVSKWYMWYTTCPKCAKEYGKNYVVIIGRIQ